MTPGELARRLVDHEPRPAPLALLLDAAPDPEGEVPHAVPKPAREKRLRAHGVVDSGVGVRNPGVPRLPGRHEVQDMRPFLGGHSDKILVVEMGLAVPAWIELYPVAVERPVERVLIWIPRLRTPPKVVDRPLGDFEISPGLKVDKHDARIEVSPYARKPGQTRVPRLEAFVHSIENGADRRAPEILIPERVEPTKDQDVGVEI